MRRVWLTSEEESSYYDGFANEGLWPLCHIAHTRPIFRESDWERYKQVNEKFAAALLEEMEGCSDPIVFVQDYHFALLPRLSKKRVPMRAWRSSGISPGRIRSRSAFAHGRPKFWMDCWVPT